MDKSMVINVDGENRIVHTFATTVGGALASAGLQASEHDAVAPTTDSNIGDGGQIVLKRGRPLRLTVNGQQRQVWTYALTAGAALRSLGVPATQETVLSVDRSKLIPLAGMAMDLKTAKLITVVDGGRLPRDVATYAATVEEMLHEQGLDLQQSDTVTPAPTTSLANGIHVEISRIRSTQKQVTETLPAPEQVTDDPNLTKGKKVVDDPGAPGQRVTISKVTTINGKFPNTTVLETKVVKEPKPKIVRLGTKQIVIPDSQVWDELVQCESTSNWAANTGNGFYGGLQFTTGTWAAYGGTEYAPRPDLATREEQILIATKVRDAKGGTYGDWPMCRAKLGLP